MPAYDYTCPKCGWRGTRYHVPSDDRDAQHCAAEHTVTVVDKLNLKAMTLTEDGMVPDGTIEESHEETEACGAPLVRDAIAATQGRMSYNWSKWQT